MNPLGIPISFNNIVISNAIGSGLVEGSAGVSGRTIAAWLETLFATGGVGVVLYREFAARAGTA